MSHIIEGTDFEVIPVNESNVDPRQICILLLDVSGSMFGAPIKALNRGYESFRHYTAKDPVASLRVEAAVVEFDSSARIAVPMQEASALPAHTFSERGSTNLADAIDMALDMAESRKKEFKNAGLEYFRPWIVVMSDGEPNGGPKLDAAVARLESAKRDRAVTVFSIGIGEKADMVKLGTLSAPRPAARLDGLRFEEFFEWLTKSLSLTASTDKHGSSDVALESKEGSGQDQLPPLVWSV